MGYRSLGKIIGIATNRKGRSQEFTLLVYRQDSFEEINVHGGVIEKKELERKDYISRLEELKKDPKYSFLGKPEISPTGKIDRKFTKEELHVDFSKYFEVTEPRLRIKPKEELIKSGLPETQEKPYKRAVGFDQTCE